MENNQHHRWLVRLLIGLLPDTQPFQWVVTRDWCSARWPWESEGTHRAELSPQELQSTSEFSEGMNHTADGPGSLFPICHVVDEDARRGRLGAWGGGEIRVVLHWGLHRGRLVSVWVTPAHELIAGKSVSRSTHWANWVPVFVWDDGEGVPPYRLWPVTDTLWLTERRGFRRSDETLSFLSFHCSKKTRQRGHRPQ